MQTWSYNKNGRIILVTAENTSTARRWLLQEHKIQAENKDLINVVTHSRWVREIIPGKELKMNDTEAARTAELRHLANTACYFEPARQTGVGLPVRHRVLGMGHTNAYMVLASDDAELAKLIEVDLDNIVDEDVFYTLVPRRVGDVCPRKPMTDQTTNPS